MNVSFSGSAQPWFGADKNPTQFKEPHRLPPGKDPEDRFSLSGKTTPIKLPDGKMVHLGSQYQGLSPAQQVEAAINQLEHAEIEQEIAAINQKWDLLIEAADEIRDSKDYYTVKGYKAVELDAIYESMDGFRSELEKLEEKRDNNFLKKLEYLKLARLARVQSGELLPIDRERPKYLYHLSTEEGYQELLKSTGMKPYEDGSGIEGIWTVDLKNFNDEWSKKLDHKPRGTNSAFEALIHWKAHRVAKQPVHTQKLVLLQIEIDPSDTISVRNNNHLFNKQDPKGFINSIQPLEELSHLPKTDDGLIPEYILHNEIPLNRIKVFSDINPALQLPSMKIGAPDLLTHDFFNPHLIDPEQDELVKEELGLDLKKARSSYSAANRPNPFDIRTSLENKEPSEEKEESN